MMAKIVLDASCRLGMIVLVFTVFSCTGCIRIENLIRIDKPQIHVHLTQPATNTTVEVQDQ